MEGGREGGRKGGREGGGVEQVASYSSWDAVLWVLSICVYMRVIMYVCVRTWVQAHLPALGIHTQPPCST
jgi:hypothetical protein